jgi:acyl-coenzyme A thioesterase 13
MSSSSEKLDSRTIAKQLASIANLDSRLDRVYAFWDVSRRINTGEQDWLQHIVPHLSIHSHDPSPPPHARITFRFNVLPIHGNMLNHMHGGCVATLFDHLSTMPLYLIQKSGFWVWLGVSRSLNVNYLRPAVVGTTVEIDCRIVQAGKSLCLLKATMRSLGRDGKEGEVLAECTHDKVNTDRATEGKL